MVRTTMAPDVGERIVVGAEDEGGPFELEKSADGAALWGAGLGHGATDEFREAGPDTCLEVTLLAFEFEVDLVVLIREEVACCGALLE